MFHDITLSTELTTKYKQLNLDTYNFTVHILTTTSWPVSHNITSVIYPTLLQKSHSSFSKFYGSIYSGRKLSWLPHLGSCDLKVLLNGCKKELNVNSFALLILIGCFNDLEHNNQIPFERIQSHTGIPQDELKRTLQSLSVAKYKILLKSTKGLKR